MATMTCPKCRGQMTSYERNGITVDQCDDCRGIFLDRGELDHLLAADTRAHTPAPSAAAPPRQPERSYESRDHEHHGRREYRDRDHRDHEYERSHSRKKQKHWVEELFG